MDNTNHYIASAPASLILTGEHAVLHGYPAIVCAIDQRIRVELIPREDNQIHIHSALGEYQTTITNLIPVAPFEFVLTAMQNFSITQGFDLNIQSDFSHKTGLGSSAAVTVSTIAAMGMWLNLNLSADELYQRAYHTIKQVQKMGSGADVAAAVHGGIVLYQLEPFTCQSLGTTLPLYVIYSGNKVPTTKVIAKVNEFVQEQPATSLCLFHAIGACTEQAVKAIQKQDWQTLGKIFNQHQKLQASLGVSNAALELILETLHQQPGITGAKISGAGLGDCVIALGELPEHYFPHDEHQTKMGIKQLSLQLSRDGVRYGD